MASGGASYSVSATNYGARSADSYFILSAPDTINGPLHVTGNLTVDGTSQLAGAVTCGAGLLVSGAVTCGAGLLVSGTTVNLVPSGGSITALGGGGTLTVGDNTTLGTAISLNGSVGCKQLAVVGAVTAGGSVVVGTPTANAGLTVNGLCTIGDGTHVSLLQVNGNIAATGNVGASNLVLSGSTISSQGIPWSKTLVQTGVNTYQYAYNAVVNDFSTSDQVSLPCLFSTPGSGTINVVSIGPGGYARTYTGTFTALQINGSQITVNVSTGYLYSLTSTVTDNSTAAPKITISNTLPGTGATMSLGVSVVYTSFGARAQ